MCGDGDDAVMSAATGGRTQVTVGFGAETTRDRSVSDEVYERHRESPSSHWLTFDVAQL